MHQVFFCPSHHTLIPRQHPVRFRRQHTHTWQKHQPPPKGAYASTQKASPAPGKLQHATQHKICLLMCSVLPPLQTSNTAHSTLPAQEPSPCGPSMVSSYSLSLMPTIRTTLLPHPLPPHPTSILLQPTKKSSRLSPTSITDNRPAHQSGLSYYNRIAACNLLSQITIV